MIVTGNVCRPTYLAVTSVIIIGNPKVIFLVASMIITVKLIVILVTPPVIKVLSYFQARM